MPYRRLPNTDLARIRAMKAALKKGALLPPFKLAYSQSLYVKLKAFLPAFEKAVNDQKHALTIQAKNNKSYQEVFKKAQMYVSHFIQVMNLAVLRGEFPESVRKFYGFKTSQSNVPSLNTEAELLDVGNRLIKGEKERTMSGGSPILSPKISMVNMHYDKFVEASNHHQKLKDSSAKANLKVASLRTKADEIILDIWNEVEAHFEKLKSAEKREQCMQYGLVYVYRKSEKESIKRFMQMSA
jgi:hypothetical protein